MGDNCLSEYFFRWVNFACIFDEEPGDHEVEISSAAVVVVCMLSIVLDVHLFKIAEKQAKLIVSPAAYRQNDKTYCILSLYMVKLCRPYVVFHALYSFFMIFRVALGDYYQHYFYTKD